MASNDIEMDVPTFGAVVPDVPPHNFRAEDVEGAWWQYDAHADEWVKDEEEDEKTEVECEECGTTTDRWWNDEDGYAHCRDCNTQCDGCFDCNVCEKEEE